MGQRDILLKVSKLLLDSGIPYFLSGGFASSYYGFPRATHDVDFILEIGINKFSKLQHVLNKLDNSFLVDQDQAKVAIEKHTQFNILETDSAIKVDFWPVSKNDFDRSRFQRKKLVPFDGQKIWMVSPEDLILIKLLWCKDVKSERHMRDCAGILEIQKSKLDESYLKKWAKKLSVEFLLKEALEMKYFPS